MAPKKGRESNGQSDSQPLKVRNRPDVLVWRCRATHHWKALNKGYNFALDLISIWSLHAKLLASKVTRIQIVGILGLPLGSLETKCHLDVGLVERHKVYYKGEGGGFPQVWAMVSLVSPSCSWLVLAPQAPSINDNKCLGALCCNLMDTHDILWFLGNRFSEGSCKCTAFLPNSRKS
jgi:hypothetical protein